MTDSEFLEMSRLLDSLTKGADTLRVVFSKKTVEDKELAILTGGVLTTRDVATDDAKAHPAFKDRYFLLPDREVRDLVSLINWCKDWTSEKHKASALYQKMRAFISASSGMPKGVSGIYKIARSKCLELIDLISGIYPELYPPFVRDLLAHQDYEIAKKKGWITPPFTWNDSQKELAFWLDGTRLLTSPVYMTVNKRTDHNWVLADCVFRIDGEPVTAKQLSNAYKKKG